MREELAAGFQAGLANCRTHGALIIDDALPLHLAERIAGAFPLDGRGFSRLDTFRERKFTTNAFDELPALLKEAAFALQQPELVARIGEITGITDPLPDPTSYAGGLSLMVPGDFLNPHIDNSHNGDRTVYRRLNLLYYLADCEGGELELWDSDVKRATRIAPNFNRLVIMETNRSSWHSVAPVRRGVRPCISSYYFTEASPDGTDYYHVTSFTGRPGQRVRRAWGAIDNRARQVARELGAGRGTDLGYQAA